MSKQQEYQVYDHINIAVQKLQATPGNVVVIYVPHDMVPTQKRLFADLIQPVVKQHEITMMIVDQGTLIQELDESRMKEFGWIRDPNYTERRNLN